MLNLEEKPLRILLLGLTSLGLVKKRGDYYSNSAIAERLLTAGKPGTWIPLIKWQHFINYRAMYHFADAIRTNTNAGLAEFPGTEPTLYQRLVHQPELEKIFQDAMQSISLTANRVFSELVDLSHVRHLVDVGGGNATNIIALANRYPQLRASVFDSPTVCEIARKNIDRVGLSGRLDAVSGNCFNDPFPESADCILFCHFFTIWSEQKDQQLLKKCFDGLKSGGSVIIFNMMQRDDETGPLTASVGSPYFLTLATGESLLYTAAEYAEWMKRAGFQRVQTIRLPFDHAAIIGTKL
jgi:ubiquinone/menaquinone biosynthesis C-methylase UbiE